MFKAQIISVLLIFILAGCESSISNLRREDSVYGILEQEKLQNAISQELVLIADNQLHNLIGEQSWLQLGIFDEKVTHVAIRPPLLDYYSDQLLRYALRQNKDKFIIHLGDSSDISCTDEFENFLKVMNEEANGRWLMTPGNHDSLYFGNYDKNDKKEWSDDCNIADKTKSSFMNKRKFMDSYLKNLLGEVFKPHIVYQDIQSEIPGPKINGKVFWRIESKDKDNWNSYLLQIVNISKQNDADKAWMILLDTTQYDDDPKLITSPAGTRGRVGAKQWKIVDKFVKSKAESKDKFVLAGHSPLIELDENSKAKIIELKKNNVLLYVSAHTHQGNWFVHQDDFSKEQILELNIGSITDSRVVGGKLLGPSYRTLKIYNYDNKIAVESDLFRLDNETLNCNSEWHFDNKFYTYEPSLFNFKKTKIGLLKMLVEFHAEENNKEVRLFQNDLAKELLKESLEKETIESLVKQLNLIQTQTELNPKRVPDEAQYQACQAYWASQEENYWSYDYKNDFNKRAAFSEDVTAVSLTNLK